MYSLHRDSGGGSPLRIKKDHSEKLPGRVSAYKTLGFSFSTKGSPNSRLLPYSYHLNPDRTIFVKLQAPRNCPWAIILRTLGGSGATILHQYLRLLAQRKNSGEIRSQMPLAHGDGRLGFRV